MIRTAIAVIPAALIIVFVLVFGSWAFGAEACRGQMVTVSWYGKETCHGRPPGHGRGKCVTAADVPFNGNQWLVAHKSLKFGTKVRFTYRGRSVTAPVLDRGPYIRGRGFDLSHAVARALGMSGVAKVCAEVLG